MISNQYMKLAIDLAKGVVGQTSPNPPVGAVVVKDNRVVGVGLHMQAGDKHAEVLAIEMAGEKAMEADLYVTLEPCAHHGKTPPCSNFIVKSGIRRVFVSAIDPNPLVAGKGIELLEAKGIDVEIGLHQKETNELYKIFFKFIQKRTPYITMKLAMTADGKIAAANGDSKWITSENSRYDTHQLRDKHDAILVGIETILTDNPNLTTRLPQGGKNPIRIILDTHLRILEQANVIKDRQAKTIIFCGSQASREKEEKLLKSDIEVIRLENRQIDLKEVVKILGNFGVMSLLVEGGSTIYFSFIQEKLVDELIIYMAPKILGGSSAISSIGGEGFSHISKSFPLAFTKVELIEGDIKITACPLKGV